MSWSDPSWTVLRSRTMTVRHEDPCVETAYAKYRPSGDAAWSTIAISPSPEKVAGSIAPVLHVQDRLVLESPILVVEQMLAAAERRAHARSGPPPANPVHDLTVTRRLAEIRLGQRILRRDPRPHFRRRDRFEPAVRVRHPDAAEIVRLAAARRRWILERRRHLRTKRRREQCRDRGRSQRGSSELTTSTRTLHSLRSKRRDRKNNVLVLTVAGDCQPLLT